jgi:hypothetical protein
MTVPCVPPMPPLPGDLLMGWLPIETPVPSGWICAGGSRPGWAAVYRTMIQPDEWMRPPPEINDFTWLYSARED